MKYSFIYIIIAFYFIIPNGIAQEIPLKENKATKEIDSLILNIPKEKIFPKFLNTINKFRLSGDYTSTIIAINLTNDYYNGIKNPRTAAALKTYLGQAYNGLGLYSESIKNVSEALIIAKESKNLDVEISSLMILSEAYSYLGLQNKGNELMTEAYKISDTINNLQTKKLVLGNLIANLLESKKLDSSKYYIKKLEKLEKFSKEPFTLVHLHKGDYFFQKNKLDSAIYYCNLFEKELPYFKNDHNKVAVFQLLSEIYLKNKDYKNATDYAIKALKQAKKNQYYKQLISIYELLSNIYKKSNNIKSFVYKEKYYLLKDSLSTANMGSALKNVKLIYRLRNKTANVAKLKIENKLKSTKINSLIFLLLGAMAVIIIIIIQNKKLSDSYKRIVNDNIKSIKDHEEIIDLRKQIILDNKNTNIIPIDNSKINISQEQCNQIERSIHKLFDIEKIYLKKGLDLDQLANLINTNRVYLSYVFNNIIKTSFSEMLNKYRINEAKKLLILNSEKYTIEAIAHNSGFKNKATFNRNFKKHTGITPSIFLKFSQKS